MLYVLLLTTATTLPPLPEPEEESLPPPVSEEPAPLAPVEVAPEPPPPPVVETPPPSPTVDKTDPSDSSLFFRFGLGSGWAAGSDQRDALETAGFQTGRRLWLTVDGNYLLTENIAIGPWGATWGASDQPESNGPTLHERTYLIGAQAPLRIARESVTMLLVPRLGYAWGTVDLGTTNYKSAPAYGVEGSVLVRLSDRSRSPSFSLGLGLGMILAPSPKPGELGEKNNLGGYYLAIIGGLDE